MFLSGSRTADQWLNLGPLVQSVDGLSQGSLFDTIVWQVLIIAGMVILWQRRLNWVEVLKKNPWVWLFFIYGLVSIIWSDDPFVSFKRVIKALGNVIMAMVILSETRPFEAIGVILRRLAFVLLPLSILFIKYYPHLGRTYQSYSGSPNYGGVVGHKSGLGMLCLYIGIYYLWELFINREKRIQLGSRLNLSSLIILCMIVWLFYMAKSATSSSCMVIAACIFLISRGVGGDRLPGRIFIIGIACIALFGIFEFFFDITGYVIEMLGKDHTLTSRVPMWQDLLNMVENPIIGFGFENFWMGNRRQFIDELWGISSQAHNGYLEMYLNLGFIGLLFVLGWILSGLKKVVQQIVNDYQAAMLRLCFIVIIVIYNWTEATFFGVSNMWLLLFFSIMEIPISNGKRVDESGYAAKFRFASRNEVRL
jgi:O-antigen ligase